MPWPNFLVIGAPRCGTTSLYRYLSQHPEIYMSPIKETNYFAYSETETPRYVWGAEIPDSRFEIRSDSQYRALFEGVTGEKAIGEVSPVYFASDRAADAIAERLPDARLVAILRDPVDRAYSGYQLHALNLKTRVPLREMFEPHFHWVRQSFYYPRIRAYLDRFDRRQMKVVLLEDLASSPHRVMSDLFEFLGIEPGFRPDIGRAHNVGGIPRSRPVMALVDRLRSVARFVPPAVRRTAYLAIRPWLVEPAEPLPDEVRDKLRELFEDDILRLSECLDVDFGARWGPP